MLMKETGYTTTIGLEIHLQLSTRTKAFCGCMNKFGAEPNSSVCPVCLGFPGSLPVLNRKYLRYAIKVALALNCKVADMMKFDRKNYFYPDLPKNYQISQYDMPLSSSGHIDIPVDNRINRIGITRVHMEEDAGKLIHDENKPFSYVDFNRTGTPLLEIVSDPDISSPDEAYSYLRTLKAILEYLDVSDCNMQEGSLRCDANISIKPKTSKELGIKVELKNMNTFKGVRHALEYEEKRQMKQVLSGREIVQETRLWNEAKKATEPMRTKEEAHDYRYFPEPDLVPFKIDRTIIEEVRRELPEMPKDKQKRFVSAYSISEYDASILVADRAMSDYFELSIKLYKRPKPIANWLIGDVQKYLNANNKEFKELGMKSEALVGMLKLIDNGTISNKIGKEVLEEMLSGGKSAEEIVKKKGLKQIADQGDIEKLVEEVINENKNVADDYIAGKDKALSFLIGQLMRKTKGKVNPQLANQILQKKLKEV